jgi:predicted RNA polymerase sigma factor
MKNAFKAIADNFQPRLLHFRLTNYSATRSSSVEAPGFTSETLRLARALGACLPADPEFAQEVVELLRPQDAKAREKRLCSIECVLVELLWGLIHRGAKREISVAELAEEANALLRSRGEILVYSSEEVGWRLRALGVSRHSSAAGRR